LALLILKLLGRTLALLPEAVLQGVAAVLGDFIFFCLPRRRRVVLSNLQHAFPDRTPACRRALGRESCRRLIETGLLSLATPFLSVTRLRRIVRVSPELSAVFAAHHAAPAASLICSPHLACWEAQTSMALALPDPLPEFGIIFRPVDNPAADEWVRRSRERFGMRLLSRREGFAEALKILRRKGFVGVLFDQNAGMQGALTTLFGRVCSTTELPGLMAEKFDARVYGIFPRRRAFWRVEIGLQPIASDGTTAGVTLALNRWLETLLAADDNLCASWLWVHDRWRHQDVSAKRFRLESKRDLLGPRETTILPRKTRIWIRLPNWLGDVVMALPLIRALRKSRPDAEITLIARPQFLPLLEAWGVADRLQALPQRGPGYFAHFWRARHGYPDVYLLLTNSVRGDLEAWLTRCPQRFGLTRPGRSRPLLTHRYEVPGDFDEARNHQFGLWENLFRHFGLNAMPDLAPFSVGSAVRGQAIALICGSENTPEKRWPVAHWRALIDALPDRQFVLFGTDRDKPITAAVARDFAPARVSDRAGQTSLPAFAGELRACALLVTNDTGGMHLANASGVPLIALFGPTNPLRTGPIFSAPCRMLQPPGCPPTGGGALEALAPAMVIGAVRELLAALAAGV
jgi:lauroyl/myristoyl acyltransferase/ADP-heptose:LPS heptosyltransferase